MIIFIIPILSSLCIFLIKHFEYKYFCQQTYRQRRKEVHRRMLLDKHGGQTDQDHRHHNETSPKLGCVFLFNPDGGNTDGVRHVQRWADAGIGIKPV